MQHPRREGGQGIETRMPAEGESDWTRRGYSFLSNKLMAGEMPPLVMPGLNASIRSRGPHHTAASDYGTYEREPLMRNDKVPSSTFAAAIEVRAPGPSAGGHARYRLCIAAHWLALSPP